MNVQALPNSRFSLLYVTAVKRGNTSARKLADTIRLHQLDHGIYFFGVAYNLNHQGVRAYIHDRRAERLDDAHNFRSGGRLRMNLDQGQLASDHRVCAEVYDFNDVDQLVQLLRYLLQRMVIACRDDDHAGQA